MPTDSALDNDNPSEVPSHAPGARFHILDSLILAMVFVPIGISPHKSLANRGARQIAHQARTRQPV
jgi:hypothetical protein